MIAISALIYAIFCGSPFRGADYFRFLFARIPLVAALIFCQCGSDRVDVSQWNGRRARIRCLSCNQESWLDGFTLSDFDLSKLVTLSLVDQARKYRKRSPDEIQRIQSAKVGAR